MKNYTVRPWIRYWARWIDMGIAGLVFGILAGIFSLDIENSVFAGVLAAFLWVFIEAGILSLYQTSPGKCLLNIKINKKNISYSTALKRSFGVYIEGLGFGISIIGIVTLLIAYKRLNEKKITRWDEDCKLIVYNEHIGLARILIAICLTISLFSLMLTA